MINPNDYLMGKGMKLVMVVTADDGGSLGDALQKVIDDIGMGKQSASEASDEYFYTYRLDRHEENV